ncbi:glycosyltransferase family 39 protein [bacterium]|nr:glycosyltransferase family 39 protein [bacterium]
MVERSRESLIAIMAAALLIAAGVLLQFYHLSRPEFYRDAPARSGAYAALMNADGAWLAPAVDGQPQFDASPMHLWAVKIASRLRPNVKALNVRAPGALCALLLSVLVAWWFFSHAVRYGREDMAEVPPEGFGLLAGLITASSPFLIFAGRSGSPAAMFTLIWLAAAFCWGESLEARRSFYAGRPWRVWVIWGYLLAGLGMLIYGPFMLLLLWVPYVLAARSYHLSRPTIVHFWGLLLALLIGGLWPAWASIEWPARAAEIWRLWLTLPFAGQPPVSLATQGGLFVLAHLPWLLLALVMAVRVKLRKDRSPTLVFWMNTLVGAAIVLLVAAPWTGGLMLPLVPIVALLSADALFRWNFEHAGAVVLRGVLRVTIALGLLIGYFIAFVTESGLGQSLLAVLALSWLVWTIRAQRHRIMYSQWQTTVRLTTIAMMMLVACEAAFLADWVPREQFFHSTTGYFSRVRDRLESLECTSAFLGRKLPGLYMYYLRGKDAPRLVSDPAAMRAGSRQNQVLFARDRYQELAGKPGFVPLTFNSGGDMERPYDAMYLALPAGTDTTTMPLRIALIGNSGSRHTGAIDVGRRMNSENNIAPIDHVLTLGNNVWGPGLTDHLDFTMSFEHPFGRLLRHGVLFHATLGHEDQSYAWIQTYYPPFRMDGHRYYAFSARGGLADCFMLDSEPMLGKTLQDMEQVRWLEKALSESRARWKIVCFHQALLTAAGKGKTSAAMAATLIPIFERHGVNLVAWGNNAWYERLRQKPNGPVYINGGWSGGADSTGFARQPFLQASSAEHAGFVMLDITDKSIRLRAINRKGQVVDKAEILPIVPPTPQK